MQADTDGIVAIIGIVIALSVAFGKFVGPLQTEVSQAIIDALQVRSRFRRVLNMVVGLVLGIALTAVAAIQLGEWSILPAGILAGIMAAVEASRVHDRESETATSTEPP